MAYTGDGMKTIIPEQTEARSPTPMRGAKSSAANSPAATPPLAAMSGGSRRAHHRAKAGCVRREPVSGPLGRTEVVKNKQADRRGQIAVFARTVDLSDQFRQRHMLRTRDLFQVGPEWLFKADASLVSTITTERLTIEDFIRVLRTPPSPLP